MKFLDGQNSSQEMVPGTIRLYSDEGVLEGHSALVLFPTPSQDPSDPLNWRQRRKYLNLSLVILYVLAAAIAGSALYSIYLPFSESTGLTIDQLNQGAGYQYLIVGFSPLVVQPFALAFGKRLTYLLSMILAAGFTIWSAHPSGNGSWIAIRLLLGCVTAPVFSLCEVSIADVFFAHERALPMACYVLVLYVGALIAPLLGAYIFSGMGFRAVLYMAGGFLGISFIICLFLLEETNFERQPNQEAIVMADPSAIQPTISTEGNEKKQSVQNSTASQIEVTVVGKTSSRLRLGLFYPHPNARKIMWRGFIQPILMLRLPIIWWSALQYAIQQVWFNLMNALTASILGSPPYNFDTNKIGLAYISPIVFVIPTSLLFGSISDRFTMYMARRNGGISEPEHKLWLMLPLLIIVPLGLLMMGCGAEHGLSWAVYVIGMGILCMGGAFGTDISLYYIFDCYHELKPAGSEGTEGAAPYLLSILIPAMSISFAFNYAIGPWVAALGLQNWAISATGVSTFCTLTVFPMLYWGKALRKAGARTYLSILEM
ncbi:MFS general substrate transporter [Meredithblackwellia eburnea MCA 4105]